LAFTSTAAGRTTSPEVITASPIPTVLGSTETCFFFNPSPLPFVCGQNAPESSGMKFVPKRRQCHETCLTEASNLAGRSVSRGRQESFFRNRAISARVSFCVGNSGGRALLDELVREGMLSRTGKGKRGDAFRYFLPENRFCATSNLEVEPCAETNKE
jgi:hypothetical protein